VPSVTSCLPSGPRLFAGVHRALRARNVVRRPPFVMYYRTCRLPALTRDLTTAGFAVTSVPLTTPGRGGDQAPRCVLVLARKAA